MEITDYEFEGLNNDLKRLLKLGTLKDQLDSKIANAEFVRDGYNGRCSICYKDLSKDKLLMISDAESIGTRYKMFLCQKCASDLIKDYQNKVYGAK